MVCLPETPMTPITQWTEDDKRKVVKARAAICNALPYDLVTIALQFTSIPKLPNIERYFVVFGTCKR
ncbi:hypothetical protein L1887_02539 [Cichorium endivia]|nr:hypothetical protein L1887_02539 [Cichorium endivia]